MMDGLTTDLMCSRRHYVATKKCGKTKQEDSTSSVLVLILTIRDSIR